MSKYLLLFIILPLSVWAQTATESQKALKYLDARGEVYLRLDSTRVDFEKIATMVSLDHKTQKTYRYAYANRKQINYLNANNIPYEVLVPPSMEQILPMATKKSDIFAWNVYPTYDQYVELMNEFVTRYPDLCKLEKIGTSINGRELLAVKISDNVQTEEDEPNFLYTSSIHGDETTGYILLLRLIDHLLSNYATDQEIRKMVDETEIWINPLSNPDGTYAAGNNTVNGATRNNAASGLTGSNGMPGVDLNRNYPDPRAGLHPDANEWQTENIAMMDFLKKNHFVMAANLHTGEEVVNYPWDTWAKTHPDDEWYQYVSRKYADAVHANAPTYYMDGFDNGITNGAVWYIITGGRQDYHNYYLHSREVTIELSTVKMPNAADLPNFWNYNSAALMSYMQQCQYGIRGIVSDSETGLPLAAKIEILSHDKDSSQVYTDPRNGDYHRLIFAGTYSLKFSAKGYTDKVVENVAVVNDVATPLDVKLTPVEASSEWTDTEISPYIAPNPVTHDSNLHFFLPTNQQVIIQIRSLTGALFFQQTDQMAAGSHQVDFGKLSLPVGAYVCDLRVGSYAKQIKLVVVK